MSAATACPPARVGLDRVLAEVTAERDAQHRVHGLQHHLPDGTRPRHTALATLLRYRCNRAVARCRLTWRHILAEEVAEALAESDPARLRAELIQVAAVAVQ